ncbi:phosphate ABC transporter membrane protein 2, PhoT family (TC 3.A.1.7.1) [Filomicrobium insigne]|uniref:Phosphate transport system permease protein PstA n=2 Tax=Filomicrobium insigne TaxID=418854 RepID=A0A1H0IKM7_9HYPH|nr:phosphate ABC transporter membrane protein 2, PhoT family (TC 3.A.1.7.1) [Filomicrobium insigne]
MATTQDTLHAAADGRKLNDPAMLKRRYAAEWRFKAYGLGALGIALFFLVVLFYSIISQGWTAFLQTNIKLDVALNEADFQDADGQITEQSIRVADYTKMARDALQSTLGLESPTRPEKRDLRGLLSRGVDVQIRNKIESDRSVIGQTVPVWVLANGEVDALIKGSIDRNTPEERRQLNNKQLAWIDKLIAEGRLEKQFNTGLFTYGASSQPETAGLAVALIGSFFMMLIVALVAVPIGVAAAAYLEEFAPKNTFTDIIEVNINNLAAVPSIVFGLLGLAVFINFMGLPRSASLVGGLVLSLMTLPTVIIATRAAIRAVPPSIREAALGVGASKMQTLFHHVLPLALPGILTGTIIGLVQALGETAPLLMIGLVAFVVDYPTTPLDPATALPVQIYMWASSAERGFVERTMGATIVLLMFLFVMNAAAVYLRRKFERKW